ncbi:MAG TPA: hypothetical protein VKB43_12965 [Gaiellaceae bacterium]|nr:hypothetical protein [Gaiellaceae bacterium]
MRTRVAMVVAAVGLIALAAAAETQARSSASLPRSALVPNAVAFIDRKHGLLGTGWENCASKYWHCRLQGTISVTSDGGRTWHVVLRTRRPVVAVDSFHDGDFALLDNGQTFSTAASQPRRWRREGNHPRAFEGYCPKGWSAGYTADFVDTNIATPWSLCGRQPGAGNQAKAVYRGTKRVAFTAMTGGPSRGGISSYGYAAGISGVPSARGSAVSGFGIIWETRGTLYATRDGGRHWHALPKVARPEVDFGDWADADVYPSGTAFVLLSHGGGEQRRLIETTNAGRTWHVVHRWR